MTDECYRTHIYKKNTHTHTRHMYSLDVVVPRYNRETCRTNQSPLVKAFVSDYSFDFSLHVFYVSFAFDVVIPEVRGQTGHVPRVHAAITRIGSTLSS